MEILSVRLLALRKSKKLSRQVVSDGVGISTKSLERYEIGEREPDASVLANMARYFGVSSDYLLGLTDDPAPR